VYKDNDNNNNSTMDNNKTGVKLLQRYLVFIMSKI